MDHPNGSLSDSFSIQCPHYLTCIGLLLARHGAPTCRHAGKTWQKPGEKEKLSHTGAAFSEDWTIFESTLGLDLNRCLSVSCQLVDTVWFHVLFSHSMDVWASVCMKCAYLPFLISQNLS